MRHPPELPSNSALFINRMFGQFRTSACSVSAFLESRPSPVGSSPSYAWFLKFTLIV